MNIWIMNHYAGSVDYGMEFRHYYFARELKKKGYNVSIIAGSYSHLRKYNPDKFSKKSYIIEELHEGITFKWIKTRRYKGNGRDRAFSMLEYYFRAVTGLKKFDKPDLIIASSPHPFSCLAALKIGKKYKIPVISEVRDLWPEALVYYKGLSDKAIAVKALKILEHKIYSKSDALIFTKPGDVDYLKEQKWLITQGGDVKDQKCYYVNNGVDIESFDVLIKNKQGSFSPQRSDSAFVVTYIGTIREVNNLDMLLDAANVLKNRGDIYFDIYGDGEELHRLVERKKQEGLDNVYFAGRVDKEYIPNILSRSSVNILNYSPTLYNWSRGNSSNKLFEYMASGKPVISTVKMGYSPIVEYDCGIEIDSCDGNKLAQSILSIKESGEDRLLEMSRNARIAAEQFDYSVLAEKIDAIITSTVRGFKND